MKGAKDILNSHLRCSLIASSTIFSRKATTLGGSPARTSDDKCCMKFSDAVVESSVVKEGDEMT